MGIDDTLEKWFCLKSGRKNFQINPINDGDIFLGGHKGENESAPFKEDIAMRLKRSMATSDPIKLIWWGQFGIGKTKRLTYVKDIIEKSEGYTFYPVFALMSDLQEKSGPEVFHARLFEGIGYQAIRNFSMAYKIRAQNKDDGFINIQDLPAMPDELARILNTLTSDREELAKAAWRYILGYKLSKEEMRDAGSVKPQIDSGVEFAKIHQAFAYIIKKQTGGNQLLYLIDEFENVTKINNKNQESRWQESLRLLLDVAMEDLGIIITVGADREDGIPALILKPDIARRIQITNYVQLSAYERPTTEEFLIDLLCDLTDHDRRKSLEAEEQWEEGKNGYSSRHYPFTDDGFAAFCNHASEDVRSAKPSEILHNIDRAAFESMQANSRLITAEILSKIGIN
jgi:hypothetical protein